jgi:hypothetical protein
MISLLYKIDLITKNKHIDQIINTPIHGTYNLNISIRPIVALTLPSESIHTMAFLLDITIFQMISRVYSEG